MTKCKKIKKKHSKQNVTQYAATILFPAYELMTYSDILLQKKTF